MPGAHGIFVYAELRGEAGARIREIQRRFDPRLAGESPPHVTLVGSSGAGVVDPDTPVPTLRAALAPLGAGTAPLVLPFQRPHRFMSTNIVVLPLDPHGPTRGLHDRLVAALTAAGVRLARAKFTFTPHATLSFYRTLAPAQVRELLALRVDAPAVLDELTLSLSRDPQPPRTLLRVPLAGAAAAAADGPAPDRAAPDRAARG